VRLGEAEGSTETLVPVFQPSWCHIPKDHKLHVHCHERLKADLHIACHAHAIPLLCRAAKGLECVFPIWFTWCGRIWFTLAITRPCPAPTMLFFWRPRHRTAVERRPVGDWPAFSFFWLPRGVPRRLSTEAYQSEMQAASVKPYNICHGRGKEW
jgi:hypothetical protein